MSLVYVGLPVRQHSRRFHFDKGRRWNAVEHLLLQGLAHRARTAGELVGETQLPRRVVLEVLIRLMRAGWVELKSDSRQVIFHATDRGQAVAKLDELPAITERMARRMAFAVDMITGSVFRRRDLSLISPSDWDRRTEGQSAVLIARPVAPPDIVGHISTLIDVLFDEEEQLVRVDMSEYPPFDRIALFAVRDGNVEGLPHRAPQTLRAKLLEAAADAAVATAGQASPQIQIAPTHISSLRPERQAMFRFDDVVLGGAAHQAHLTSALQKARRHVLIHSTFLDRGRFEDLLPSFRTAVAHGARVDILWGQSSTDGGVVKSLQEAEAIHVRLQEAGLSGQIHVHRFSTRSHAKLLIADDGAGRTTATIGSCNWLLSGFNSYEASVRLKDPHLVSDVLYEAAELARPQDGQLPELSARLAQMARQLLAAPAGSGSARLRVLIGPEHDDPVLKARDEAQSQITVLSHRLGVTAKPAIVVPMAEAAKHRNVDVKLYYGKASGPVEQKMATAAAWTFREQGVELVAVQRPRIHAKMLLWDDDNAVITSLNWLSADTLSGNPRQEIGVSIKASRLAAQVREAFDHSRALAE